MGYELDVKKEKGRFIIDKILGLLQPETVDVDKFDFHCCLRPVCGDDVPIIGQTRVIIWIMRFSR